MDVQIYINKLIEKQDLTQEESLSLMEEILRGTVSPVKLSLILTALRMKGESVDEIVGFIRSMRSHMLKIKTRGIVVDTCGTGGDGKGTFNISTAVAFVVAGAGVKVAKHGNRSASSLCGSADVLEALGININLSPIKAEELLLKTNFTFLFAPVYHPAMKFVTPVRNELKTRTVFNFSGPFVNPAGVRRQLIGVPNKNIAEKLAHVAVKLDYELLLIVAADDGLDEISICGKTHIYEIKNKKIQYKVISAEEFGIDEVSIEKLKGKDIKSNATIIKNILKGEEGPRRDIFYV